MQLIVDEDGTRRTFRLGEGLLSIGSAEDADLRLGVDGVAGLHAQLTLSKGVVTLRPLPGGESTTVGGLPVKAAVVVKPREVIRIGTARIWCVIDAGEAAAAAAGPRAASPSRSIVKPRPRRAARQYGLPTWAVILLLLLGVVVALPLLQKALVASGEQGEASPAARLDAARQLLDLGDYTGAERRLELATAADGVSAKEEAMIAALHAEIAVERAKTKQVLENRAGTNYKNMLAKYEQAHLEGDPEPAKARLFLKRAQVFRERWPDHPEVGWVERQASRFIALVDPSSAPSWRDVEWEVKVLVRSAPRNYAAAFRLLDDFLVAAEGGERVHATKIRDRFETDRVEYHAGRIDTAKREFDQGDTAAAVWWLVHEIIWSGDEKMAVEAARILVRMPDVPEHLRGYEQKYPDKFAALLEHPDVLDVWERDSSG